MRPRKVVAHTFLYVLALVPTWGCAPSGSWERLKRSSVRSNPAIEREATEILRRADGACVAKVLRIVEKNEMPSDGDHFLEIWLEPIKSTGNIPEYLYVVIQNGGNMPFESLREVESNRRTQVLTPDSLKEGELHWFVFSNAYDSTKYPYRVAGWWRHEDADVPTSIIQAIENNRFANHPVWDPTLDLIATRTQDKASATVEVHSLNPPEADELGSAIGSMSVQIEGEVTNVTFFHHPFSYELQTLEAPFPPLLYVESKSQLAAENPFNLPPKRYRIHYAYDLSTHKQIAQWVAAEQDTWRMHAFQQYDTKTDDLRVKMIFDLLDSGGRAAGAETEAWYRKTVETYVDGKLADTQQYRHQSISTGLEPIYSSTGWIPLSTQPDH